MRYRYIALISILLIAVLAFIVSNRLAEGNRLTTGNQLASSDRLASDKEPTKEHRTLLKEQLKTKTYSINYYKEPAASTKAHSKPGKTAEKVCMTKACHGTMQTDETPWHKMHLSISLTNFKCGTCHSKPFKVKRRNMDGTIYVDRTVCLRCHRDKFPAFTVEHQQDDWVKVHKTFRDPAKTRGADIPTIEQLQERYPDCFICHRWKDLGFCKDCHKFHPHNDKWINGQHGRTAVKTDFICLRCHEKTTWCTNQCHEGVTLPHNIPKWTKHWKKDKDPVWWRAVHFQVAAEKGKPVCMRCHDSPRSLGVHPDFCMECHHAQFYEEFPDQLGTPWKPYAMKFVRNNGSSRCWQCHLPDFCVTCHTTGNKPPPHTTFVGPR